MKKILLSTKGTPPTEVFDLQNTGASCAREAVRSFLQTCRRDRSKFDQYASLFEKKKKTSASAILMEMKRDTDDILCSNFYREYRGMLEHLSPQTREITILKTARGEIMAALRRYFFLNPRSFVKCRLRKLKHTMYVGDEDDTLFSYFSSGSKPNLMDDVVRNTFSTSNFDDVLRELATLRMHIDIVFLYFDFSDTAQNI